MDVIQLPDKDGILQVLKYEDVNSSNLILPDSGGTPTQVTLEDITNRNIILPNASGVQTALKIEDVNSRTLIPHNNAGMLQEVKYEDIINRKVTSNPGDKIPAFYDIYYEAGITVSATGTSTNHTFSPVPTGAIMGIRNITCYIDNVGTNPFCWIFISNGTVTLHVSAVKIDPITKMGTWVGTFFIPRTWYVYTTFKGYNVGAYLQTSVIGEIMRTVA